MSLVEPGPIALRAVADAEANVGVVEQGGENHGKAVETYLRSVGLAAGAPWCAAFVHYRLREAAREIQARLPGDFPVSGYCPDYQDWAKKHGVWIPVDTARSMGSIPERGDLCLFYFAAKRRVAHIGMVAQAGLGGALFQTVEGNTGPETGVNRDGDGVYKKSRSCASLGEFGGFIRLVF